MKQLLLLILLFGLSTAFSQDKKITVEKIWKNYEFFPSSVSGFRSMNDGNYPKKRNKKGLNCFWELGPISSKQETLIFHYWMVADDQALRNRYIYMLLICTCSSKKIIYTRWTTMKKDSNIPNLMTKVCLYVE